MGGAHAPLTAYHCLAPDLPGHWRSTAAPNPTLLVAGEREPTIVRTSNAAQAALMPHAIARFAPGRAHGWLVVDPELHLRMAQAWIDGQQPPAELLTETTPWSRAKVARLLGRPESELESPARRG